MSQGSGGGGSALVFLLPILLIAYLFFTQRRRQRAAVSKQQSVQVGDEVRTTSGLFGYVVSLEDAVVVLEAAPGVHLRFDRRAIAHVVQPLQPSGDVDGEGPGSGDDDSGGRPDDRPGDGPAVPPHSPISDR